MKKIKLILLFLFIGFLCMPNVFSQENRIEQLQLKLESVVVEAPGLNQKADINVSNLVLSDFLRALSNAHQVNMNISSDLNTILVTNNFSNVTVSDILLFICKEYNLTIDFNGNILSIRKMAPEKVLFKKKEIPMNYNLEEELFSIDLEKDSLYVAFKEITLLTKKNLVFAPGLENQLLTSYIQNMPFDGALEKIAFANNLIVTKTRDNYYLFESATAPVSVNSQVDSNQQQRPERNRRSNFYFKVLDTIYNTLEVDFENIDISNIVYDVGQQLNLDMFTVTPLDAAGNVSVKAQNIKVDVLFDKILENTQYTFKNDNGIYYFGKRDQVSLRNTVVIPLLYRSIEILKGKSSGLSSMPGINRQSNSNYYGNRGGNNFNSNSSYNNNYNSGSSNSNRQRVNTSNTNFQNHDSKVEALVSMLPEEVKNNLDIQTDVELNSFIVSGPEQDIEKFRAFVKSIDKPIPNINIEVMFIEINKSSTVETGITWGIGDAPVPTKGTVAPVTNFTIGAQSINRMLNSGTLGSLNLGSVVPEFFINIKALETNGDIKVRSTPKLSALNGHTASFSAGETTYYAVTERNIYGSQNPQTSEITNYYPLEAQTAINIKPIVSAEGNISMEINVVQSSFNGKRIDEDAPPGVNSREFTSVIRVNDQDLIVLGGLEEVIKNDSGTGVPLLSRIPIIKWFFSSRKREDSKKKLVVFIKPTIIY